MDDQTKSRFTAQTLVAQALGAYEPVTRPTTLPIGGSPVPSASVASNSGAPLPPEE